MKKPSKKKIEITDKAMRYLLPMVQRAVQGLIDKWEAEREIENYLDTTFDNMANGIEDLAIAHDTGGHVSMEMAKSYIEELREG